MHKKFDKLSKIVNINIFVLFQIIDLKAFIKLSVDCFIYCCIYILCYQFFNMSLLYTPVFLMKFNTLPDLKWQDSG